MGLKALSLWRIWSWIWRSRIWSYWIWNHILGIRLYNLKMTMDNGLNFLLPKIPAVNIISKIKQCEQDVFYLQHQQMYHEYVHSAELRVWQTILFSAGQKNKCF